MKNSKIFEEQLRSIINSCGLPIDTAYYILKSICLEVENVYIQAINNDEGIKQGNLEINVDEPTCSDQESIEGEVVNE